MVIGVGGDGGSGMGNVVSFDIVRVKTLDSSGVE